MGSMEIILFNLFINLSMYLSILICLHMCKQWFLPAAMLGGTFKIPLVGDRERDHKEPGSVTLHSDNPAFFIFDFLIAVCMTILTRKNDSSIRVVGIVMKTMTTVWAIVYQDSQSKQLHFNVVYNNMSADK